MLKYLMVILDDSSTSYCYYSNFQNNRLIDLQILNKTIKYAMVNNLTIHYIYPEYELPKEYNDLIDSYTNIKIKSIRTCKDADIIVINDVGNDLQSLSKDSIYILRISLDSFEERKRIIVDLLYKVKRLNIVILDIDTFTHNDFLKYKNILNYLMDNLDINCCELNLLNDRIILDKMNNCNPGIDSICIAPNGNFYLCPAFYYSNKDNPLGDVEKGLFINNKQLLSLENAPICRHCDAFQCKRCVWLNHLTTLELNTPSHEQCVVSHIERNASAKYLDKCKLKGMKKYENIDIKDISYLDPFENKSNW